MIFKKTATQGNFIFSNGQQALFKNGFYTTDKEDEIAALSPIYEEVTEEEFKLSAEEKPVAKPVQKATVGAISSVAVTAAMKK